MTNEAPIARQVFGRTLVACQFRDADGVGVVASLNVDQDGVPFELDMWKVDSSPLIAISSELKLLEDGVADER